MRTVFLGDRVEHIVDAPEVGTVLVTASRHGIVFNGWAPAGLLSFVRSDVRTMVADAEVT